MTRNFKKSLLALALAGVATSSMAAGSGVIDVAAQKTAIDAALACGVGTPAGCDEVGTARGAFAYGSEYLANFTGASVAAADFDAGAAGDRFITYLAPVVVGIDHSFKFDVTNGAIAAATDLELRDGTTDAAVAELIDFVADGEGNYTSVTFKFATAVGVDDVLYMASAASAAPLTGIDIVPNAGITAPVTIALTQAKDASALDLTAPLAPAETLVQTVDQFTAFSVDDVTSVIDVNLDRQRFVGPTNSTAAAIVNLTINPVDVGIDVAGSNYELTLVDTSNLTAIASIASSIPGAFVDANDDGNWLLDDTDLNGLDTSTITITVAGDTRIEEATYAVGLAIDPSNATTDTFTVGSDTAFIWELNAATAMIPYMPYGAQGSANVIDQIVYVTNKGEAVGDITVDVWDEAGDLILDGVMVGETKANGITNIGPALKNLVDGTNTFNQKARIRVIANVPQDDMEVYSAYNVRGNDRGLVINNSNVTTDRQNID